MPRGSGFQRIKQANRGSERGMGAPTVNSEVVKEMEMLSQAELFVANTLF
jgi:hypothetical protein